MNRSFKFVYIIIIAFFCLTISSCSKPIQNNEKIEIDVTNYKLLEGTIYETTVYKLKSSLDGGKYAIIGGIHGDEVAGWKAALSLINLDNFKGEIMLIPQANILADNLLERYPGAKNKAKKGLYDGIMYDDINRNFPGKEDGNITQKIAYTITKEIEKFNPEVVVDLHESLHSYTNPTNPRLGNEIIYGNIDSSLVAEDLVNIYNAKELKKGEDRFSFESNSPDGSLNHYFGLKEGTYVFTIETNRELIESRRIEQQVALVKIILDYDF